MTQTFSQFIKTGAFPVELVLNPVHSKKTSDNVDSYENTYFSSIDNSVQARIGLVISENGKPLCSALIGASGGGTGIHQTSHIVYDDKIVICCADSVFCISIPELKLLWSTKADTCTCFQVFKFSSFQVFKHNDDYIVHREMEISRLDSNGQLVWQNGRRDIFTSLDGKDHFKITEKHIEVRDWDGELYMFGFDGTLLFGETE